MALHTAALPELGSLQWPRGEPRLRVLTHNVWAIPFIGKRLDDRMPEFVARIARSDYDVIILQEVRPRGRHQRACASRRPPAPGVARVRPGPDHRGRQNCRIAICPCVSARSGRLSVAAGAPRALCPPVPPAHASRLDPMGRASQSGSTGLCIMSRFPFIDVGFHRFGSNGKPAKVRALAPPSDV